MDVDGKTRGPRWVCAVASGLLTVAALAVGLGVGEVGLRLKNADMRNYDIEMWRYSNLLKVRSADPLLGHEHRPMASAVLESVEIRTNRWGLRGGPVADLPPNGRRILVLGASITLGWGVAEQDTMTTRLQSALDSPETPTQVLNAGIGNYNAARYVELFMTRLAPLQPTDLVVHYFLRDAETLDAGGGNWLLRHSELAMTLWIVWTRQMERLSGDSSLVAHYQSVYRPQAEGYKAMAAALATLADYAKAHGIRLYLAVVPDIHDLGHYQLGFAHQQVMALAGQLGYRTLDLLPSFGSLAPDAIWAMPGDPHPNALGHKLMADALAPILRLDTNAE